MPDAGFEKLPAQGEEVAVGDAPLEQAEQFPVMDGIEVALEIAFDDVEVFGPPVEQPQEDGDGVHRAPPFAKAARVRTEVRLVDRVENRAEGFLDDPISEGGNPQRARLPIAFGDEDPADGERLVRL